MSASKVSITFIVFIFISIAFVDVVSAQSTNISNELEVYIEADGRFDYNATVNLADPADEALSNYNLTWKPFFENNTERGITITPLLAPWIVRLNKSISEFNSLSTGSFFRLDPHSILDGSAESWWRLPIHNLAFNATINMRIYRSDSATFNVTMNDQSVIFENEAAMHLVYNITIDQDYPNETYYQNYSKTLNVSVPDGWMNFTYLKVTAPIFPDVLYFVYFNIIQEEAVHADLFISPCDFGNDEFYNSWVELNGDDYYFRFDLDMSMLFTIGMSHGVTGIGFESSNLDFDDACFDCRIDMKQTIDKDYFNYIIPVINLDTNQTIMWSIELFGDEAETDCIYGVGYYLELNQTQDFIIGYEDISANITEYLDHVQIVFKIEEENATELFFWGASDVNGYTVLVHKDSVNDSICQNVGKMYFALFGEFTIDDYYWVNTEFDIVVIPMEEPVGEVAIYKEYQKYKAYLRNKETQEMISTILYWIFAPPVVIFWNEIVPLIIEGGKIILDALINWFLSTEVGKGMMNIIYAIGTFIRQVVEWAIPFFEWLAYWGVRLIYSFGVGMVYMINTFAMITICSAFYQFAKTKKGIALVNEFEKGWKFIWTILSLLISFAILIVGIISAVMPG